MNQDDHQVDDYFDEIESESFWLRVYVVAVIVIIMCVVFV